MSPSTAGPTWAHCGRSLSPGSIETDRRSGRCRGGRGSGRGRGPLRAGASGFSLHPAFQPQRRAGALPGTHPPRRGAVLGDPVTRGIGEGVSGESQTPWAGLGSESWGEGGPGCRAEGSEALGEGGTDESSGQWFSEAQKPVSLRTCPEVTCTP